MKVTGGCHCGAISFKAEVDPAMVTVCHCTDCQTLTGSAFRVVVAARREAFSLKGQPKIYVKTGESGRKRAQGFCATCGTPIYSADVSDPQIFNIRVGTILQRADLPPQKQIWCRSALGWTMHLEPVEQVQKQ